MRDEGNIVKHSIEVKDCGPGEFSIPTQADVLFVYANVPG